jgi:hypothetical protein
VYGITLLVAHAQSLGQRAMVRGSGVPLSLWPSVALCLFGLMRVYRFGERTESCPQTAYSEAGTGCDAECSDKRLFTHAIVFLQKAPYAP